MFGSDVKESLKKKEEKLVNEEKKKGAPGLKNKAKVKS
jgi:hypothetical protein